VLPGARRFADHGVAADELRALEQVTVNARTVAVDEASVAGDDREAPAEDEDSTVHPLRAAG
jgi:hypothetical protein